MAGLTGVIVIIVVHGGYTGFYFTLTPRLGLTLTFLRQKERAQKARKLGLSGLSASFPYMNFALLISTAEHRFYLVSCE